MSRYRVGGIFWDVDACNGYRGDTLVLSDPMSMLEGDGVGCRKDRGSKGRSSDKEDASLTGIDTEIRALESGE